MSAKPSLPSAKRPKPSKSNEQKTSSGYRRRRTSRSPQKSDVLISAVVSTYLLTHLHHILQRAEYGAVKDGKASQAANFAELRKVLCMDARSMDDASALGNGDIDNTQNSEMQFLHSDAA
ncbi:hypothetical protein [Prochlorococcus sp. MIT 1300]|uniref:hypothetical protein n=1 Tax=Prochlorococcus sp. MIT 1300 TaxID=3096218 RepID=UPI002A74A1A2|nr:hypothetical protein [Prochlorococcus sp. MIT 1300]